jgi:ribosomal protein S18 acetylase RimI-like enzyme
VTLAVAADNAPARSLYESVGFEPVDRRPDFYASVDGTADEAVIYAYDVTDDDPG